MRKSPAVITTVLVGTMLSVFLWSANAEQPKPNKPASDSSDSESMEVRFARAHLALARLDVQRAEALNKKTPNLFSPEFMEKLRLHVAIDEAQLAHSLEGKDADVHEICIRSAETAVKIAESDLKRRRAFHKRIPTTTGALDVERAKVAVHLAKLHLERTKGLENSESVLTHLQWQVDQLRHQVLELQMQVAASY